MLEMVLRKEGFRNIWKAVSGEAAIRLADRADLILLDVMLPGLDGFEVCRRIREQTDTPILFLTAKTAELDLLMGLEIGGDDYITKPFQPLEVAARVKAHLRRQKRLHHRMPSHPQYNWGYFQIHPQAGLLTVQGEPVDCPAREFQLLVYLCESPDQIFSVRQLYEQVWGELSPRG